MTPGGWMIMGVSVGSIVALTAFCFWRLLAVAPHAAGPEDEPPAEFFTP